MAVCYILGTENDITLSTSYFDMAMDGDQDLFGLESSERES